MNKRFFALPFAAGLAVLAWVGLGFIGGSWLAAAVTALIAAAYLLGAYELAQFRRATAGLDGALQSLSQPPAALADWLQQVPAPLRNAVRLRVEGERGGLPGPALTPYLVGLLVMLGMLGTFLGMVVTFKGAVFALQGSTDLQAIRAALAEPIKGLGLSFGTSVAGVAASAMLGLMATIARRERLEVARALDGRIAGALLPFSLAHQRQESLRALQAQANTLPRVVDTLQGLMERIEQRSQDLDRQLLARQSQFQQEVAQAYGELARTVGASLKDSLAASAQAAGETLTPVVESTMAKILQESQRLHAQVGSIAQDQVERFAQSFEQRSAQLLAGVRDTLGELQAQQAAAERKRLDAQAQRDAEQCANEESRMEALAKLQAEYAAAERKRLDALAQVQARQAEAERERLQAIAEVAGLWRGEVAAHREQLALAGQRDAQSLQERGAHLERFGATLQELQDTAGAQRAAIEQAAAHVGGSAVELASVAEAFQQGVQLFQASSDKLVATLASVEASLHRSTARSDEQLAYYVAQAREVIDLSIASQQGVLDHLRQLQAPVAEGARA